MKNPADIEASSFDIIDGEIGEHSFSGEEYQVVRRVIHSSADFDFRDNIVFSAGAVKSGTTAIKNGVDIICDVQMVMAGINKPLLEKFNTPCHCFVSDPDVAEKAKSENVTRSIIAMRKAAGLFPEGIYVTGNAPTALLELVNLIEVKKISPALVIGVPVGFVSAVESKEKLSELSGTEYITSLGRKGGSTIAVSCVNALFHIANNTCEK